jgi:beta-glucosidase/6-phospho-beta-glucosidase/beta-galactosidase/glycosyltransferase involved in cell wall biosynthesis
MNTETLQTGRNGKSAHESSARGSLSISDADSLPIKEFIWGAGVECSFLAHLNIDQYEWTQHNRFWRQDLKRAREELGLRHLRYAFPWHILEAQRGQFDWSYADERMAYMKELGINVLLDVMHFGTPLWLKQAVGDPEFPEALESFTQAIVERYRDQVSIWCPFNEPLVSALFSGDFGFWPPHSRNWKGYMPVVSRIVQGVSRSIRAIRRTQPDATVLLCDAVESYKSRTESLAIEVRRRNLRRFLVLDLLTGSVDRHHPLFPWLTGYGLSELDIDYFRNNPQSPDVLGLDYYPHSDWQLDVYQGKVRQRRADNPVGLYGVANAYFNRYGLPMMLTETSIEGQNINREIWLETMVDDTKRLREEGIPMLGFIWWPLVDQLDWDGALTHRVGKIHQVGLVKLSRQKDGTLERSNTPLVKLFKEIASAGEERIGKLAPIALPTNTGEDQGPPIGVEFPMEALQTLALSGGLGNISPTLVEVQEGKNGNGKSNGENRIAALTAEPAPGLSAETPAAPRLSTAGASAKQPAEHRETGRYGIVVFSHLRWGFVWQRPQQFLSRFARKHPVLFVEEPFFDQPEGTEPQLQMHRVMPNVTVACPHLAPSWNTNPKLPDLLRKYAHEAIEEMNDEGAFDRPVLWYYSPMDSAWSLGHFENRGIIYDSMDELSQFTGAPKSLIDNERRLMKYADIVFAGGYELSLKKKEHHHNVHFFGCGVEFEHFAKAQDPTTVIPPDIDFMARPILGWFGVVDERVDYTMIGEVAREKPEWSIAMVGPVVKVDPNLLPHAPNLYWMGGRDYQVLPNYCRAFDVNMMCFAINAATQYINPTKALEYMATGKPIVSTPVKDVIKQYSDLVEIASGTKEFIAACERAIRQPDKERIQRGIEKARQNSWESTVKTMQGLIAQAIGKDDRPSKQKVQALEDLDFGYTYQATQGS